MAIEPILADVIRKLRPSFPNDRVLCLGYPDILTLSTQPQDPERQSIAKWHRWPHGIEDAGHFFGKQELDAEYWDVTVARGPERIADLNTLSGSDIEYLADYGAFGCVIDPGTIEHIANIGNCWKTLTAVTAIGGVVVHCNPFGWANHGMYSISPTAYLDVYGANGFDVEALLMLSGPLENRTVHDAKTTHRFHAAPDAMMLCVARKRGRVVFNWPIQSKYRANPMLKAATPVMNFAPDESQAAYGWDVG
jgi:hypothetical protein